MKFNKAWLTVTHNCNLGCGWCYDRNNMENNKFMDLHCAIKIIDFLHEVDCNSINLIGGEPTLHPNLEEIIEYATEHNITTSLVTNGILLSDNEYIESLCMKGLKHVFLSYKGKNNAVYQMSDDEKNFEKIIKSIENIKKYKIDYVIDLVVTSYNIDEIHNWICDIRKCTDSTIHLSICKPAIGTEGITNMQYIMKPKFFIKKFQDLYMHNKEFASEKFVLHQTLPSCLWNKNVIEQLKERKQIGMGCQLLYRDGIIFDVNGELLLCNGLAKFPYGKFGESFKNKDSMLQFYCRENIKSLFNEACRLPDSKCDTCKMMNQCRGGCAIQWFSYSFSQILDGKEEL